MNINRYEVIKRKMRIEFFISEDGQIGTFRYQSEIGIMCETARIDEWIARITNFRRLLLGTHESYEFLDIQSFYSTQYFIIIDFITKSLQSQFEMISRKTPRILTDGHGQGFRYDIVEHRIPREVELIIPYNENIRNNIYTSGVVYIVDFNTLEERRNGRFGNVYRGWRYNSNSWDPSFRHLNEVKKSREVMLGSNVLQKMEDRITKNLANQNMYRFYGITGSIEHDLQSRIVFVQDHSAEIYDGVIKMKSGVELIAFFGLIKIESNNI